MASYVSVLRPTILKSRYALPALHTYALNIEHWTTLTACQNCEDKFQEVAESPNFNFIGNINIGSEPGSLPLTALAPHYDAILFAYGASKDKKLGIPGEDTVKGIYSARAFVGWYNGLPEYSDLAPDLTAGEEAIVIGQGNVALDVARILLTDLKTLRETDITEQAIDALSRSRVKSVRVVGRRGAMQAAFTIKEVRELMNLPSVAFSPLAPAQLPPDISQLPRAAKRIMQVLAKGSASPPTSPRSWSLDFQLSPTAFNASASNDLSSLTFEQTTLDPDAFDLRARATGTGAHVDLPADLAFRSIGYKSAPLTGLSELGIPFDERRGIILNDQEGRVLAPGEGEEEGGRHVPGMYAAGWVKRGPTGVIASTMADAFATADRIAADWFGGAEFNGGEGRKEGWEGVRGEAERRGCRRVSWADWRRIDEAERERGRVKGKRREKFTTIKDMLTVLD